MPTNHTVNITSQQQKKKSHHLLSNYKSPSPFKLKANHLTQKTKGKRKKKEKNACQGRGGTTQLAGTAGA